MNEAEIVRLIEALDGVQTLHADGNRFFYIGEGRTLPFATLITNDLYDQYSDLDRPGVFRLNIGVGKASFAILEAERAMPPDPKAFDHFFPHPEYAQMFWISVLNPGRQTGPQIPALLAEAAELSRRRLGKARKDSD